MGGTVKSYIIMEGGGVKGCALAGALAAAEEIGVEPLGFGGSSAGAIIAVMAAAHYTGQEIGQKLIALELTELLDGNGNSLRRLSDKLKSLEGESRLPLKWYEIAYLGWKIQPYMKQYWHSLGMYDGSALIRVVQSLVQDKPDFSEFTDKTTFREFSDMGAKPLRIVTSNVTTRKPIVFCTEKTPDHPVLDAVRSSAGYPLVFQPAVLETDKHHLVDGGLSSNLPCFLFSDEYMTRGIPTLLFDLCQPRKQARMAHNILEYFQDLFATALESSDHILRWIGRGTIAINVDVPDEINTLDFFIKKSDREWLFDKGYQSTSTHLNQVPRIQTLRNAGSERHRQLVAMYGEPGIYQPILESVAQAFETRTDAADIRVSIFLPTDLNTLMNTYNVRFGMAPDKTLELPYQEGAAWDAFLHPDSLTFCDLLDPGDEYQYALGEETAHLVEGNRKSLIAIQIPPIDTSNNSPHPLAVLSVDTSTELKATGWTDDKQNEIHDILNTWIPVIQRMFKANLL